MPGVSTKITCPASPFLTPRMRFLVVCGLSETMAIFVPTSRLSSVDLPALGRPTRETKPDFMGGRGCGLRASRFGPQARSRPLLVPAVHHRRALEFSHPHLVHPAALGF